MVNMGGAEDLALDLALRQVRLLEGEVARTRELLHIVYSEALTLEAWREELPGRTCLRVELAVVDRDAQLSGLSRLELAEFLAQRISERMAAYLMGGDGGGLISIPFLGGKKGSDAE